MLEARRRMERLLDRLRWEQLQTLRAVEVLEGVGTAEAQEVLRTLAGGAPGAWLTREAQLSLGRLAERPGARP